MILADKSLCCGCNACAQVCPKKCIIMKEDNEGFRYPLVDDASCANCGLCKKVCPVINCTENNQHPPASYAVYNRNEQIRLASSSGGVFSIFADYVLNQNGIIYGAAMEGMKVKHIRVTDYDGLALLRGSKYVQSEIGTVYIETKEDLECGKLVLFTGTPCQIEGLKSFLRKEYDNLFTMDIICHGVPSPIVWDRYVAYREKVAGAPATRMFFRHKKYGWKTFAVLFEFSNKTAYDCWFNDDPYGCAFIHDLVFRPSCYQCSFKKVNRISDITMADFWGIQNVCPTMDDDKGTSLVMVHSSKGQMLFDKLSEKFIYQPVSFEAAIAGNPAMIQSVIKPKNRDVFIEKVKTEDFSILVNRYAKDKLTVKRIIKKILSVIGLLDFVKQILNRR